MVDRFRKAAVIGTTAWGTTLAILLTLNGVTTWLLSRTDEEAAILETAREHKDRLPGIQFPPGLRITADPSVLSDADLILVAVPSQTVRANLRRLRHALGERAVILSGVKGLELDSGLRISEVIQDELPWIEAGRIAVLSGPNLSREIARGLPASTVVASVNHAVAQQVQATLMSSTFRVYSHTDVIGVELGGALKNIIAIGAGMGDGLGYGANAKAAFMTRGLAEITRLGVALGANPLTFAGLAGMGDLIATCTSPLSRNRRLGEALALGQSLTEVRASINGIAEGVETTSVALTLAARVGVEMPITQLTARVLFHGLDPRAAVEELMAREAKEELKGFL